MPLEPLCRRKFDACIAKVIATIKIAPPWDRGRDVVETPFIFKPS